MLHLAPTRLTNRIAVFQEERKTGSEGRLSDHRRQYLQLDDSEGGWRPSERSTTVRSRGKGGLGELYPRQQTRRWASIFAAGR